MPALTPLLLAIALQDVETEIRRLGSDDPEVRDAATVALMKMEPAAVWAFRDHTDPEIRTRLELVLAEIERRRRVAAFHPGVRLDLDLKGVPVEEALERTFRPFGIEARLGRVDRERRIDLRMENATLWAALEAFRDAGGPGPRNLDRGVWFFDDAAGRVPDTEFLLVDDARIEIAVSRRDAVFLAVSVLLPPGFRPLRGTVEDLIVLDGTGSVVPTSRRRVPRFGSPERRWCDAVREPVADVEIEGRSVEGAGDLVVEGRIVMVYLRDVASARFELTDAPQEALVAGHVLTVSKSRFKADRWDGSATIRPIDGEATRGRWMVWGEDESGAWLFDASHTDLGDGLRFGSETSGPAVARVVVGLAEGEEHFEYPFKIGGVRVPSDARN